MKSYSDVIVPLRTQVASVGGELDNLPGKLLRIAIPFPGHSTKTIELSHRFGEFCISTHQFDKSRTFEYDGEYLSVIDWTVINGLVIVILRYRMPEKYRPWSLMPCEPTTFVENYGKVNFHGA